MKIRILGSGAGGGFPQWNCNCANCAGLKKGDINAQARTQSSIAISDNEGVNWILINASPDIRQQILAYPELQPNRASRDTAIVAVVLVDSQIDHASGLLMLREGKKIQLYCSQSVYKDLTSTFPIVTMLESYCGTQYHPILTTDKSYFSVPELPAIKFYAITLEGKAPPYSVYRSHPASDNNIALYIVDTKTKKSLFYAPGLAKIDNKIEQWMHKSNYLFLDGTFWDENEMIHKKLSSKKAADMGHIPQSGEHGLIHILEKFPTQRKLLIHINNTNPILNEDSNELKSLSELGIEVAKDGMQFEL